MTSRQSERYYTVLSGEVFIVTEELSQLEENMRRLKIEFDIYFNGGPQRPPADGRWRVESVIKKFADAPKLSFSPAFPLQRARPAL